MWTRASAAGAIISLAMASGTAVAYTAGTACYPKAACESGGSNTFDKYQRKVCQMLADTSKYCIIPSEPTDELSGCSRELLYHGWCDANKYVFESGCLAKHPTTDSTACSNCNFDSYPTAYWSVGAPYPLHPGMVNHAFRECVVDYVKAKIEEGFTAEGMTADATSLQQLAEQEFPVEQMVDVDDYKEQYSSYYLDDGDFDELDEEMTDEHLDDVSGSVDESVMTKTVTASCSSPADDKICYKMCAGDLGLNLEYKIKVPKVCAKIKILGKKFKKCIRVPTTKFKIPNKCTNLCVNIPGYCEMQEAASAITQIKNIRSLGDLALPCKTLGGPGEVCNLLEEADDAFRAMESMAKIATTSTVDAFLDLQVLPSILQNVLDEATDALEDIANGLENKLRNLVEHVWGTVASSSSEVVSFIENNVKGSICASSSSTASLGAAREERRLALVNDIHRGVRAAFRGDSTPTHSARPIVPNLGAGQCCYHIPFACSSEVDFPMPWPKALENISDSPGAVVVNMPGLEFNICGEITQFKVDEKVATKLVNAFGDMFEALFAALYEESGLKKVVDDVKDLTKDMFGSSAALGSYDRPSFSTDDRKHLLRKYVEVKNRMAETETIVLEELLKISDTIHSPEYLTHTTRTPSRDDVPSLGGENLFEKVLNDFADDLQTALKSMADTTVVKADMSINVKGDTSINAKASVYKIGDIIDKLDIPNSFAGVHVAPLFPGLTAALQYDVLLSMPYYVNIDMEASFALGLDIDIPISLELSNTPNFAMGSPAVNLVPTYTAAGKSSAQVGASVEIKKGWIALCAGTHCVGPWIKARQDVYVGVDTWAFANCDSGYGELVPKWTDGFSYSSKNQATCAGSLAGAGGYAQVPKTGNILAQVLFAPMPIMPSGASAASQSAARLGDDDDDCEAQPMGMILADYTNTVHNAVMAGGDNWYTTDLFAECPSAGKCPAPSPPQPYTPTANTKLAKYNARCCGNSGDSRCAAAIEGTYETLCAQLCDACAGCVAFDYQASTNKCGFSKSDGTVDREGFTHFGHGATPASKSSLGSRMRFSARASSPTSPSALTAVFVVAFAAAFASAAFRRRRLDDARRARVDDYGAFD